MPSVVARFVRLMSVLNVWHVRFGPITVHQPSPPESEHLGHRSSFIACGELWTRECRAKPVSTTLIGRFDGKLCARVTARVTFKRASAIGSICQEDVYANDVDDNCALFVSGDDRRARTGHTPFSGGRAFSNHGGRAQYLFTRLFDGKRLAPHSVLGF